jgi:hypothetical protein
MHEMLAGYIRLIVFAVGLLVGVQLPGFVDQYVKRVSAHQSEAAKDFSGFQQTADKYFGGDVQALIAHHAADADHAFQDEAADIRTLYDRLTAWNAELAALRGPLPRQILHVLLHPNAEILAETRAEYSYTVPLNPAAVICGVGLGALGALLVESVLVGSLRLLRPRRARGRPAARQF